MGDFNFSPDDVILQKTPYSFDVSVWELFLPLMYGATLVYAKPGGHRQGDYLIDLIIKEKITRLLNDDELSSKLSRNASLTANDFSAENYASSINNIISLARKNYACSDYRH